jgi:chromosome segregation ATPase
MFDRFGDWYLEQAAAVRACVFLVFFLVVAIFVLAIAGYRSASHSRDLVLEQNKALSKQVDELAAAARSAVAEADDARADRAAMEQEKNEIQRHLLDERKKLADLTRELSDARDQYRRVRRLSDRELGDLRTKLVTR